MTEASAASPSSGLRAAMAAAVTNTTTATSATNINGEVSSDSNGDSSHIISPGGAMAAASALGVPDTQTLTQTQTQTPQNTEGARRSLSPDVWGHLHYCSKNTISDLCGPKFTIGRCEPSNLILQSPECSKIHCIIDYPEHELRNPGIPPTITDVSTNGTWLNGSRMVKNTPVVLNHGDSILIRTDHNFIYRSCYHNTTADDMARGDPEFKSVMGNFDFIRQIGAGTYATVYLVWCKRRRRLFACKVVLKAKAGLDSSILSRGTLSKIPEINTLFGLNHKNVLKYETVLQTRIALYIVLEYVQGGELFHRIVKNGSIPEDQSRFFIFQTLKALEYLHGRSIIHRDIKPENMLMDSCKSYSRVLIGDFGLAKRLTPTTLLKTLCGTLHYLAPEVLSNCMNLASHSYTPSVDCWSLGVTAFFMISGYLPFDSKDDCELRRKIVSEKPLMHYDYFDWNKLTPECIRFLGGLLRKDPNLRLTVKEALQHPWIKNYESQLFEMWHALEEDGGTDGGGCPQTRKIKAAAAAAAALAISTSNSHGTPAEAAAAACVHAGDDHVNNAVGFEFDICASNSEFLDDSANICDLNNSKK